MDIGTGIGTAFFGAALLVIATAFAKAIDALRTDKIRENDAEIARRVNLMGTVKTTPLPDGRVLIIWYDEKMQEPVWYPLESGDYDGKDGQSVLQYDSKHHDNAMHIVRQSIAKYGEEARQLIGYLESGLGHDVHYDALRYMSPLGVWTLRGGSTPGTYTRYPCASLGDLMDALQMTGQNVTPPPHRAGRAGYSYQE